VSHLKDMLHMLCCNTCCSTCNTCCNMSFKTTCVTCLYSKTSVISLSTLIEETPPSGEVSYFLCSLIKNRVQKDPPRRICTRFFEGGPLTHGSWWGNIVNRKPPRGGGGFFRSTWKTLHMFFFVWRCRLHMTLHVTHVILSSVTWLASLKGRSRGEDLVMLVCCSVLQCVAVCCSVCCSVLQCDAVWCSVRT